MRVQAVLGQDPRRVLGGPAASEGDSVPTYALVTASFVGTHALASTSDIRKTRIPIESAFRNPFFRELTLWSRAIGRPRKMVSPAIAPSSRSSVWFSILAPIDNS